MRQNLPTTHSKPGARLGLPTIATNDSRSPESLASISMTHRRRVSLFSFSSFRFRSVGLSTGILPTRGYWTTYGKIRRTQSRRGNLGHTINRKTPAEQWTDPAMRRHPLRCPIGIVQTTAMASTRGFYFRVVRWFLIPFASTPQLPVVFASCQRSVNRALPR